MANRDEKPKPALPKKPDSLKKVPPSQQNSSVNKPPVARKPEWMVRKGSLVQERIRRFSTAACEFKDKVRIIFEFPAKALSAVFIQKLRISLEINEETQ